MLMVGGENFDEVAGGFRGVSPSIFEQAGRPTYQNLSTFSDLSNGGIGYLDIQSWIQVNVGQVCRICRIRKTRTKRAHFSTYSVVEKVGYCGGANPRYKPQRAKLLAD